MCSDNSNVQEPKALGSLEEENSEAQHLSPHLRHEMWKKHGYLSEKDENKHMKKHMGKHGKDKDHFFDSIRYKADPHHHHHHVDFAFCGYCVERG